MFFQALQSELFRFKFHSLGSKILKIPEFNLLMYKIPAVKRMLANPNLQKLAECKCWGNGWVQYKNFKSYYMILLNLFISELNWHWTSTKVIDVISSPNLFKCIMDPDVRQHVFSVYRVLNYSQLNEYKRTGKVSFVPC